MKTGIRKANGFSLVETMVAILVLATGVIGAARMQMAAMRTTQQSAYQTVALQLASDVAEVMRSSSTVDSEWASRFDDLDYRSSGNGELPPPSKLCYFNSCSASEFADFQIYEWESRIKAAFPSGRIRICRDSKPWIDPGKSVTWDCDGASASNAPIVIKLGWQAKNPDGRLVKDANSEFPPAVVLAVIAA
ncbi:type IV pilus modification protein PilV [Herbaspirillum sp. HC18]|nr:type IV pilus modification protein PilV [Herbaspirillum sp. HC18]